MNQKPISWAAAPLLALLLLCQACDPDRPKPEEKFYCKVDGKHWRPDSDGDFKRITLVSDLMDQGRGIYIRATDASTNQTISIYIFDSSGIDTVRSGKLYEISLNQALTNNPPAGSFSKNNQTFKTGSNHKGTFRILSIERDQRILTSFKMKAEFEFTAVSPSGKTVKITQGQFNDRVRISQ